MQSANHRLIRRELVIQLNVMDSFSGAGTAAEAGGAAGAPTTSSTAPPSVALPFCPSRHQPPP